MCVLATAAANTELCFVPCSLGPYFAHRMLGVPNKSVEPHSRVARTACGQAIAALEDDATWQKALRALKLAVEAGGTPKLQLDGPESLALHMLMDAMVDKTDMIKASLASAASHTAAAIAAGREIAETAAIDANGVRIESAKVLSQPWPDLTMAGRRAAVEEAAPVAPAPEPPASGQANVDDTDAAAWLHRAAPSAMEAALIIMTPIDNRFRESIPIGALDLPEAAPKPSAEMRSAAVGRFTAHMRLLLHAIGDHIVEDRYVAF